MISRGVWVSGGDVWGPVWDSDVSSEEVGVWASGPRLRGPVFGRREGLWGLVSESVSGGGYGRREIVPRDWESWGNRCVGVGRPVWESDVTSGVRCRCVIVIF